MIYKKAPPRAAVGLPLASKFKEWDALGLKLCKRKILLHTVNHATRVFVNILLSLQRNQSILLAL